MIKINEITPSELELVAGGIIAEYNDTAKELICRLLEEPNAEIQIHTVTGLREFIRKRADELLLDLYGYDVLSGEYVKPVDENGYAIIETAPDENDNSGDYEWSKC